MISVSDPYDLIPDLFDNVNFVNGDQPQCEILPPGCVESFRHSDVLTVFVQPEPDMNWAPQAYARQIAARPNNIFAVSGFSNQCDWQLQNWVLYLANLTMTVRVNPDIQAVDIEAKSHVATALLGGWMVNRGIIVKELEKHNILSQCLVNYHVREAMSDPQRQQWRQCHPDSAIDYRSPELDNLDHPVFLQVAYRNQTYNALQPIPLNTCQPIPGMKQWQHGWISQLIPRSIYNNAYISIVAETECMPCPDAFFVSEKVAKPLIVGHPFVIFGCQHYLKHLRSLGLKTFSPWIDESYDNINDATDRAKALVKSVIGFAKKTQDEKIQCLAEMKTITDHNRKLVLNTDWQLDRLRTAISSWFTEKNR